MTKPMLMRVAMIRSVVIALGLLAGSTHAEEAIEGIDGIDLVQYNPVMTGPANGTGITLFGVGLKQVWVTHPDVLQAISEVNASSYDISGAMSGFYPYAQVQNINSNKNRSATGGGNGTLLQLILPIWNGGSTLAEIDVAKATKRQAESGVSLARLSLGQRYSEAYFGALAAQNQVTILEKNLISLIKLNKAISHRAEEGASPDADVKTALTRLHLAEAQLAQQRAVQQAQRALLKTLLNGNVGHLYWPLSARLDNAELTQTLTRGLDGNPNILKAVADIAKEEAQVRVDRGHLSPTVSLQHQKPIGSYFNPISYPEQTQLVVQFQTDTGYKAFESYRGSKERLSGVYLKKDSAQREVEQTVVSTQIQMQSLGFQLKAQHQAVVASVALVESSLRQYAVGRKTWIEVLNAQREATDTQLQYVSQQQSYWLSATKLALVSMYWDEWLARTMGTGSESVLEISN